MKTFMSVAIAAALTLLVVPAMMDAPAGAQEPNVENLTPDKIHAEMARMSARMLAELPHPADLQKLPEQVREVAVSIYQLMLEGTRAKDWNDAQLQSFLARIEEISDDMNSNGVEAVSCFQAEDRCEIACTNADVGQVGEFFCNVGCDLQRIGCNIRCFFSSRC